VKAIFSRIFASFGVRNYRLYIIGQGISMCGNWMQTIGLSWLVFELTHSGTQVGIALAAQYVPVLVFGVFGGVVADNFNKRHTLLITQTLFAFLSTLIGFLIIRHSIHIWMIYTIASLMGLVTVFDTPSRQSFVVEMVGREHLRNAVTLNSTIVNVIGPSIAGVIIATAGVGPLFILNGLSYVAVIIALYIMDVSRLYPAPLAHKESGQIRAGLKYAWHIPTLRSTLIMMFIIGTFAYEFPVILPLFATKTLHGNASLYSELMVAMGIGAVFGGLYSASKQSLTRKQLIWSALLFGGSILIASIINTISLILFVMVVVGALSVLFISLGNTTLQLSSEGSMRGRVMSLWSIGFQGTTPIGGPIIGFISDHSNPRVGLAVGGFATILAGIVGCLILMRAHQFDNLQLVQSLD
jgi:MFS family permease